MGELSLITLIVTQKGLICTLPQFNPLLKPFCCKLQEVFPNYLHTRSGSWGSLVYWLFRPSLQNHQRITRFIVEIL